MKKISLLFLCALWFYVEIIPVALAKVSRVVSTPAEKSFEMGSMKRKPSSESVAPNRNDFLIIDHYFSTSPRRKPSLPININYKETEIRPCFQVYGTCPTGNRLTREGEGEREGAKTLFLRNPYGGVNAASKEFENKFRRLAQKSKSVVLPNISRSPEEIFRIDI